MQNFTYHNPTTLVFGKGSIGRLSMLLPAKAKVLLTYGGGSIKTNGVHKQVVLAMRKWQMLEFGGIEPNPRYETCMKAVELVRAEGVDFLLALAVRQRHEEHIARIDHFTGSEFERGAFAQVGVLLVDVLAQVRFGSGLLDGHAGMLQQQA